MKKARFLLNESGATAVEFALLVPILLLILMGIVDYGTFINQKMKMQDLARTVTQYVVQGGADADVQANILEASDFYNESVAAGQVITVETDTACECADGVPVSCAATSCAASSDYIRYYYSARLSSLYTPIFVYPGISNVTIEGYSRMQYNQ